MTDKKSRTSFDFENDDMQVMTAKLAALTRDQHRRSHSRDSFSDLSADINIRKRSHSLIKGYNTSIEMHTHRA